MRKLLIFVLVFILGLVSVNAYQYSFVNNISYSCYQESANTTNQTGIDGNCNLNYSGNYLITNEYLYINYTKPVGNINSSSWMFRIGNGSSPIETISLPNSCLNYNNNSLQLRIYSNTQANPTTTQCYNGSWNILYSITNTNNWNVIISDVSSYLIDGNYNTYGTWIATTGGWRPETVDTTNGRIYEESIYWYSNLEYNRSINYSFSSPSGVFSESSNIVLNLSKGSNQSYSNADLIYNGVTYSNPTQSEFSNYTLFTQSISNSAIGNFTYAWNISLTDYGNVFNFTTVNGSHVVTGLSLNLSYFDTLLASMSGKNVTLTLIGAVSGNYSTSTGTLNISNLSTGTYTLLSSSSGYNQNSYVLILNSSGLNPLSLYLQPLNVTYYALITVKDKYSKDYISDAEVTIQRYINNAWVTEQIHTTDFNGQTQGYFVIDTQFYNFLISKDGVTYFGVIDSNANKKVIYAQDITNGINIEIDTNQNNEIFNFLDTQKVGVSINFTNTSNSTGYFTFRWTDSTGNSRNGSLEVYNGLLLNCSNSAISSSGIITCSVSASAITYFSALGLIDGDYVSQVNGRLGVDNAFLFDWGSLGWIVSILLVLIAYLGFANIPSMSLMVGTGMFCLLIGLNLIFNGLTVVNSLVFVGLLAVAFILAKLESKQGANG